MTAAIEPTPEQLQRFLTGMQPDDAPFVMVNLNRYRERAAYPADAAIDEPTDVSGHEAYQRYGALAVKAIAEVGARIVWGSRSQDAGPLMGDEDRDAWDTILCVWYPSRAAFLQMLAIDWYQDSLVHRRAGLERAVVFPVVAADEPVLDLSTLLAG